VSDALNGLIGHCRCEHMCSAVSRNPDQRVDLQQRNQHEGALRDARVRHLQRGAGNNGLVAVQQQVKIERARCVRIRTLATEILFDRLQRQQQVDCALT